MEENMNAAETNPEVAVAQATVDIKTVLLHYYGLYVQPTIDKFKNQNTRWLAIGLLCFALTAGYYRHEYKAAAAHQETCGAAVAALQAENALLRKEKELAGDPAPSPTGETADGWFAWLGF
jgi:hypothetical protein